MMRLLLAALLLVPAPADPAPQNAPRDGGPRIYINGKLPAFPWQNRLEGLKETPPGLALHWRYTGDETSAKKALEALHKLDADDGYGLYVAGPVLYLPVTYDWLSDWKGFTPADRRKIEEKIVRTADLCREFLEGRSDHVFHTSAPRAVMGVGLAAVALEGRHKNAREYLAFTQEYLEKTYFPALQHLDGAAVAGMSYGVVEGFGPMAYLLWALKSAKGIDYFKKEKWLESQLHYIVNSVLPDQTFVRWGDIVGGGRASTRDEVRPVVDMLSAAYDSRDGYALSSRIDRKWTSHGYHNQVLWLAPFFARSGGDAEIRLPTAALFGKDSVGQAFFRSGWGEADTIVFFKCGDYFDNHGHFDQGSFTIFRREHLAVRSSAYGATTDDHRMKFGRLAIAHNTIVVGDDGFQRVVNSQDSQDLADYLRKKASKNLESGDVVAWEVKKDFVYLSADITAAYDPKTVRLATRELVWLKNQALVIFDKIDAAAPPRWLLHSMVEPKIGENSFIVQRKESALLVQTLLPEKAKIEYVKGWVTGGVDYPPKGLSEFHVAGGHRIEVSGGSLFLHVLVAADADSEVPRAKLVKSGGPGVEWGGLKVTFQTSGVARSVKVR